jgi:hypothetical protein
MDAIIERLRREKAEVEAKNKQAAQERESKGKADFIAGKATGIEWAKNAHYTELILYGRRPKNVREADADMFLLEDIQKVNKASQVWANGWLEGVREFWKGIEGKL